jgi:hypothetical protein
MPSPRSNKEGHSSSFIIGHSDSFSEGDNSRLRYLRNIPSSPKKNCLKRGISKRTLVLVNAINSSSSKNDPKDQFSRIESPETVVTTDDDSSVSGSGNSLKTLREDYRRMPSSLLPKSVSSLTVSIPSSFSPTSSATSSVKEKILFFDKNCQVPAYSSVPSSPRRKEGISPSSELVRHRSLAPVILDNSEKIFESISVNEECVCAQSPIGEPTKTLKVVLLGPVDTGKTSVLKRYFEDRFEELGESHSPFTDSNLFSNNDKNIDYRMKSMRVGDNDFKFQVWDFSSTSEKIYTGTHAFAIVIDLTNIESLERIWYWVELIRETMNARVPIFIIGKSISELHQLSNLLF